MAKRALLVGCNYPGTRSHLFGCANDVFLMKSMLEDCYGFKEEDCTLLLDNEDTYTQPTAKNIRAALTKMVKEAEPGDVLFMHFSGHGVQLPSDEGSDEDDGLDEAIVPTDMNIMLDDDLREIVGRLKKGVTFTWVADCCHSGGMLDHKELQNFDTNDNQWSMFDLNSFLGMVGLKDWASSVTTINRSLATGELLNNLTEKVGHTVEPGNIRAALGSLYGADVSAKVQKYLLHSDEKGQVGSGHSTRGERSCLMGLLECLGLKQPIEKTPKVLPAGVKPPKEQQLDEEVGILITGCKSNEQSADADPPRGTRNGKAYGAMTKALTSVVRSHFKMHPGLPISNRNLVRMVQASLKDAGFLQHPCLEGSARNADSGFVTFESITVQKDGGGGPTKSAK